MPRCEFHPEGAGPVRCRKPVIVRQIAAELRLPMAEVETMVCEEGTDDQRPIDCHAFNDLQVYGAHSSYAALDPHRLP